VAETSSLLNCRTGDCTAGSNPALTAKRGVSLGVSVGVRE